MLHIFTTCQIFDITNGFWVVTENLQFYHTIFLVTVAMLIGACHHRTQFLN